MSNYSLNKVIKKNVLTCEDANSKFVEVVTVTLMMLIMRVMLSIV